MPKTPAGILMKTAADDFMKTPSLKESFRIYLTYVPLLLLSNLLFGFGHFAIPNIWSVCLSIERVTPSLPRRAPI